MKYKWLIGGVLTISLLSTLVSCGSYSSSKGEMAVEDKVESSGNGFGGTDGAFSKDQIITNPTASDSNVNSQTQRKIIDRADLFIETLEFEKSIALLEESLKTYDGYIESSNILQNGIVAESYKQNRSGEFVVRIPKDKFHVFLTKAVDLGVIINKRVYGEDISSVYYDREARLKVLKAQEDRYLDILSGAKDIKEILEIEKSLTEIRYEIESITGYLNQMDNLVSYSTINVNINEVSETKVIEAAPKTIGDKINKAFINSLKSLKVLGTGIILFLVAFIPYAVILGIMGYVVFIVYKKFRKKR